MVVKQKASEHQENLKDSILEEAKKLFLAQGYTHTSMRRIAAKVGVSATTIYLYYRDKAEVMHALHKEGFKLLNEQFKTLHHVKNPFERLKSMGRCYIHFALENRDFYEIMFIMEEPLEHLKDPNKCDQGWPEGESAFHNLVYTIDECQANGYFKGYDHYELAFLIWSCVHGICALNNNSHLELIARKLDLTMATPELIDNCFEAYVKMLESI